MFGGQREHALKAHLHYIMKNNRFITYANLDDPFYEMMYYA